MSSFSRGGMRAPCKAARDTLVWIGLSTFVQFTQLLVTQRIALKSWCKQGQAAAITRPPQLPTTLHHQVA